MNKGIAVLVCALSLGLGGCASNGGSEESGFMATVSKATSALDHENGVFISDAQIKVMTEKHYTKEKIVELFGHAVDEEGNTWKYGYVKVPAFSSNNINETTVIKFNSKNKVVKAYKAQGGNSLF
ncbi:hypothetical protein L4D76_08325 [Photobacterium sagamiensis]|uniref:hypothetical protein n=1 Tax=Photobacterium sagamiensis TaxID=2910241 RepID=UPI003D122FC6